MTNYLTSTSGMKYGLSRNLQIGDSALRTFGINLTKLANAER